MRASTLPALLAVVLLALLVVPAAADGASTGSIIAAVSAFFGGISTCEFSVWVFGMEEGVDVQGGWVWE